MTVSDKNIEIGNTVLTKTGAITHVVHLMKRQAVTIYAEELFGDSTMDQISPADIARRFYDIRSSEVTEIFRAHFNLSKAFDVVFYDQIGKKKRAMSPQSMSGQSPSTSNDTFQFGINPSTMAGSDRETELKTALDLFLRENDDRNLEQKKAIIMGFMNGLNDGMRQGLLVNTNAEGGGNIVKGNGSGDMEMTEIVYS